MKNILFLFCLCVTNQSRASGCMGGSAYGWDIDVTKLVSTEVAILNFDDIDLSDCNKAPHLTVRFKGRPGVYEPYDPYGNFSCVEANKIIRKNAGKTILLIKENIALTEIDDCNFPLDGTAKSGRYRIILNGNDGLELHYPNNSFTSSKLEAIPEF